MDNLNSRTYDLRLLSNGYQDTVNGSKDWKQLTESIIQVRLQMAIHLKFLSFMQWVFAILIVLFIGSYAYQQYYLPNFLHIVDIQKIEIQTKSVRPGGVVRYTVEIDKFVPIKPSVHRELHGEDGMTKVVITPDVFGAIGTGHFISRRDLVVPENTLPMKYKIFQVFEYPVGWGRTKSYEMESSNWVEVVNGGTDQ